MSKFLYKKVLASNQLLVHTGKSLRKRLHLIRCLGTPSQKPNINTTDNEYSTDELKISHYRDISPVPTYRILSLDGTKLADDASPLLDREKLVNMYRYMVTLNVLDNILYESQRQGRISFYMTSYGEEACQIGSAAALEPEDLVFPQYRESGVLLWRGFKIQEYINQCYGNELCKGKGRQMPLHFGSQEFNFISISSPLGTQLPQAVGAAFGLKRRRKKSCVITYFGEGAASEGDAHAAFNFAATLSCPVIFFCRNNGYAISTPTHEQYNGDAIAGRAVGYGLATIRVDGNDIFAVYNATHMARKYAIDESKAVVIEAMTYRIGHHSTSDDSSAYRPKDEVEDWNKNNNSLVRLQNFLKAKGWWDEKSETEFKESTRKDVLKAITVAEKTKKPQWKEMFNDVYCNMPEHIRKQMSDMEEHLKIYGENYPLNEHKTL